MPILSSFTARFENNAEMENVSAEDIKKYIENVRIAFHKKADARARKLNRVVKNLKKLDELYKQAKNLQVDNKHDADKIRDVEDRMWTKAKKTVRTMHKVKEQDDAFLNLFEEKNQSLSKTIRDFGHIKEQNRAFEELLGEKKKARSGGKGPSNKHEEDDEEMSDDDGNEEWVDED